MLPRMASALEKVAGFTLWRTLTLCKEFYKWTLAMVEVHHFLLENETIFMTLFEKHVNFRTN